MAEQDPEFALDVQGDSLGGAFGDSLDSSFEAPEPVTPRRRPSSGKDKSPASHRQSLAFELAQASPGNQGSSLAAELGLDGGEGIEEEEEDDFDDEELDQLEFYKQPEQLHQQSMLATPPRPAKSSASTASVSASSPSRRQPEPQPETDFEALDAELAESASAIQADLQTMERFLSNLSTYTSDVPSTITPSSKTADRQQFLERLTSDMIRTMYSAAKERESQLRELHELSRQASRMEPDWLEALSDLEPLPVLEWQIFTGPADPSSKPAASLSNIQEEQEDEGQEIEVSPATPTRTSRTPTHLIPIFGAAPRSPKTPSPTTSESSIASTKRGSPYLHGSMTSLRGQTSDLITSLTGINEHVQVHKASLTETGRKLKSLKSALGNIKAESEAIDQCIGFVQSWEALHQRTDSGQVHGQEGFAGKARAEVRSAQEVLDEASRKAKALLSDPA